MFPRSVASSGRQPDPAAAGLTPARDRQVDGRCMRGTRQVYARVGLADRPWPARLRKVTRRQRTQDGRTLHSARRVKLKTGAATGRHGGAIRPGTRPNYTNWSSAARCQPWAAVADSTGLPSQSSPHHPASVRHRALAHQERREEVFWRRIIVLPPNRPRTAVHLDDT
jgi:hypothetical protein